MFCCRVVGGRFVLGVVGCGVCLVDIYVVLFVWEVWGVEVSFG